MFSALTTEELHLHVPRDRGRTYALFYSFHPGNLLCFGMFIPWLDMLLASEGPFDGVVALVREAELAASYILIHEYFDYNTGKAPFKFAVFFGGALSVHLLRSLRINIPEAAQKVIDDAEAAAKNNLCPLPEHVERAQRATYDSDDCFGFNLNVIPRRLKINLPTLHVWSTEDPRFPRAIQLTGFCQPYLRLTLSHNGKNDIPDDPKVVDWLRELIEQCALRSRWPGQEQETEMDVQSGSSQLNQTDLDDAIRNLRL
jgi:pimeloyl-ACP methyl ester carboxylesterase